jgi:hypothetical protein
LHDDWAAAVGLSALFRPDGEPMRQDVMTGAMVLAISLRMVRDFLDGD